MNYFLMCHICIRDKDHRMNFQSYRVVLVPWYHLPSFIHFAMTKTILNSFHKLQGYFKFIYKKIIDSYIVGLLGFIISNDICNKEIVHHLLI